MVSQHLNDQNLYVEEQRLVDSIKRHVPITVILGNPPYQGGSTNQTPWIMERLDSYKTEPNTLIRLKEAQMRWINDDYIKFVRLAHDHIEKSGIGIVGFIIPHGLLSNPTFRGVRWHLWKGFDKYLSLIYTEMYGKIQQLSMVKKMKIFLKLCKV